MDVHPVVFVIDDDGTRRKQLETIIQFLGKKVVSSDYHHPDSRLLSKAQVVMVGVKETIETMDLLHELELLAPDAPVILVMPPSFPLEDSIHNVFSTLTFPFSYFELLEAFHKCQMRDVSRFKHEDEMARCLVGKSENMARVRELITQVADSDASVLILGESGTGKEVVARTIHEFSKRSKAPFIPINCGAIPSELLESELFGHEKGAFTGAITSREGRFELAEGGSIFLDEIGDMPLTMQVKLLRVLQERCFERVGSNKSLTANVRVIAATHRRLEDAIHEGTFREDLYYRLNVFPIDMPPLRERYEDLALLIHELVTRLEKSGRPGIRFLPETLKTLGRYGWPGNVRELANLIERLSILFPNGVVDSSDLPARFKEDTSQETESVLEVERASLLDISPKERNQDDAIDLKDHLAKTELALIGRALQDSDWVVARAAHSLNMRRTTLVEKMKKYGISRPR